MLGILRVMRLVELLLDFLWFLVVVVFLLEGVMMFNRKVDDVVVGVGVGDGRSGGWLVGNFVLLGW